MAKMTRDDIDKLYDYDLFVPTRTIYMGSITSDPNEGDSGVDAIMAERVIKALHILDQKDEPITIIMNNPGGDWHHGMAIYDAIKQCKSHITIKVLGMAMSMGAIILQAADERIMSPNSRYMMHYGTMGLSPTHSKIFDKWSDENKRMNKEMEQILLRRIREKHPTHTLSDLEKDLNYDTILTASETVAMGLADKVE